MTTSVKIKSHNYPVLVRGLDDKGDGRWEVVFEHVLTPEHGTREFHATTSRRIEAVDLDYDDPRMKTLQPGGHLVLG